MPSAYAWPERLALETFFYRLTNPRWWKKKVLRLFPDLSSPASLLRLKSQGPQEAIHIPLVLQGRWVKLAVSQVHCDKCEMLHNIPKPTSVQHHIPTMIKTDRHPLCTLIQKDQITVLITILKHLGVDRDSDSSRGWWNEQNLGSDIWSVQRARILSPRLKAREGSWTQLLKKIISLFHMLFPLEKLFWSEKKCQF